MGRELASSFAEARAVFDEADGALGFQLSRLCFDGPDEELKLTTNTQPAVLTTSTAAFRVLESRRLKPDFVAGHSLGEYSALVAAGALSLSCAVAVVRKRGAYMQEAVPVGVGAMAAIVGADAALVEQICRQAAQGQVCQPANLNSPEQVVIAGHREAVERAAEIARSKGAKRAVMLPVSAPFHSSLMMPAQERLAEELNRLSFSDLKFPLATNSDARLISSGDEARSSLIRQVSSPVRWEEIVRLLLEQGVTKFVEVGPGKVLCGLIRQINKQVGKDIVLLNVEDKASLEATCQALQS